MSAQPVDVLARIAAVWGEGSQEYAAVAELVEAAGKFAALLQPEAVNAHAARLPDSQGVYGINGVTITLGDLRRLNAALARVQGGAA